MTKRLRKTWRHLPAWVQGFVVVASVIGLGVGVALAIDTDNDGMSDEFESFFGLNPAVNDAAQDPDSDTLSNFAESLRWSDPLAPDTDGDLVADGSDSNPVSRAVIPWGDPTFTVSNNVIYTWPDWCLSAFKVGGQWQSDTNGAAWWFMPATSAPNSGSLFIDVDRGLLTNNLRLDLTFRDHSNATFYLDLYDTNDAVVVSNLMGNLLRGSGADTNTTLHIPLQSWTNAVGISLRRGQGEARIYSSVLYVDEDGDGLDSDMEVQLGLSDYDVTNVAPSCAITSPNSGTVYAAPTSVVIAVSASDTDGSIVRVEFFDGATKIGEDVTSPYQCLWTNMAPGGYPLSAVATDNDGASGISDLAVVILNSPGGGGLQATASGSPTYGTPPLSVTLSGDGSGGIGGSLDDAALRLKFDQTNGTVAFDDSGNGIDCVLVNGPTWTTGKYSGALYFDGVNDRVETNTNFSGFGGSFTVAAWVKCSTTGTIQRLVSHRSTNDASKVNYVLSLAANGKPQIEYVNVSGDFKQVTGSSSVCNGQWTHVAATWGGNSMKLYVNGVVVGSQTLGISPSTSSPQNLCIGASQYVGDTNGFRFTGTLDDICLFKRNLSSNEVAELMAGGGYTYVWDFQNDGVIDIRRQDPLCVYSNFGLTTARLTVSCQTNTASAFVVVTTTDPNLTPACSITSPTNNSVFNPPATVVIDATASIVTGSIAKVEFYNGSTKLGEDLTSPYQYTWGNLVGCGRYTLYAKAYSAVGVTKTSLGKTIVVQDPGTPTGTVAHLKFDETTGTKAGDCSGSGNDLTLYNGPVWTNGTLAGGLRLDGVNDYAKRTWTYLTFPKYTVAAWVKCSAPTQTIQTVVAHRSDSRTTLVSFILSITSNGTARIEHVRQGGTVDQVTGTNNVCTDQWVHLSGTCDGSTLKLYVNGLLAGQSAATSPDTTSWPRDLTVGSDPYESNRYLKGTVDDVWVFNRALNSTEVGNVMNGVYTYYPSGPVDSDGDGVDDATEILQGRDPTRGAVPDVTGQVQLDVYSPLE